MKNLDIEKLERKNIYTTPDNFFERMQENVLQKTVDKQSDLPLISERKEGKIMKINWWYAAAAAITLIFGIVFFIDRNGGETSKPIAQTETTQLANTVQKQVTTPVSESVQNYHTLVKDLTSTETENQTKTKTKTTIIAKNETSKVSTQKIVVKKAEPEQQVEQLLKGFSEEEISAIAKNSDQDIYLDLYN